MNNPIKLKKQISRKDFERLSVHSNAIMVSVYYRFKEDIYKARSTTEAFKLGDFIYARVDCKKVENSPCGCVKHKSTYARYYVGVDSPRADYLAYHEIGKLNVF